MIKSFLAASMAAVLLIGPSAASDDDRGCAPMVKRALNAAGIPDDNVAGTVYTREFLGGTEGVLVGVNAWTRLKSCASGWVVINMHLDCAVIQIYTDGPCRVAGIKEG